MERGNGARAPLGAEPRVMRADAVSRIEATKENGPAERTLSAPGADPFHPLRPFQSVSPSSLWRARAAVARWQSREAGVAIESGRRTPDVTRLDAEWADGAERTETAAMAGNGRQQQENNSKKNNSNSPFLTCAGRAPLRLELDSSLDARHSRAVVVCRPQAIRRILKSRRPVQSSEGDRPRSHSVASSVDSVDSAATLPVTKRGAGPAQPHSPFTPQRTVPAHRRSRPRPCRRGVTVA